jgi:hypothetical protein
MPLSSPMHLSLHCTSTAKRALLCLSLLMIPFPGIESGLEDSIRCYVAASTSYTHALPVLTEVLLCTRTWSPMPTSHVSNASIDTCSSGTRSLQVVCGRIKKC